MADDFGLCATEGRVAKYVTQDVQGMILSHG